jgi:DNA polymerase I-like protein with 3'-5' exonuclease and polymerase domains
MEKFWEANPGTKELKDKLEKYWETKGEQKYLPAIDGRILCTRKKSALLNTIFQSCGGIAMDYACCFLDSWLGKIYWDDLRRPYYVYKGFIVRRIGYTHDEVEFECEEPIAEEVGKMIEKAIEKAGQYLKLSVPLAGEAKIGKNWKETH